jgi:HSP20 family protein
MAELAGLTIGDIEIRVEASSVTVAGRRPAPAADGDSYLRVERGHGAFSRSFAFPQGIDGSAVAAELREGVLTIMLPKARMPEARRVTVE